MKKAKLNISIVTYKTNPALFIECASCIVNSPCWNKVYVVDNSPDNSFKTLVNKFDFEYIHLPSNPGYGSGHNLALHESIKSDAEYHLVLNADVHFLPHILPVIIKFMTDHPNVAQVMPKVLNSDGTLQRLCKLVPTPFDLLIRRFLPLSFAKNSRKNFELWSSGYDKTMFVPYLSGCFMFLRVSALKTIGIFDERFFMYPEDIDLTRRLASRFETIFLPAVSVTHLHGAASHKSIRMFLIHAFNIFKYFNKWGWFFDKDRRELNKKTLSLIAKNNEIL